MLKRAFVVDVEYFQPRPSRAARSPDYFFAMPPLSTGFMPSYCTIVSYVIFRRRSSLRFSVYFSMRMRSAITR
jgi:hypothetical protein